MERHRTRYAAAPLLLAFLTLAFLATFPSCGGSSGTTPPSPWPVLLGSPQDDFGYGIAVDAGGDILIAGETSGDLGGIPSSGPPYLFLAKYEASGMRKWIRQRGPARGIAIAVDGAGNAYVAGTASSSFDNNAYAGGTDVVLVKYDSGGKWVWSVQFGTPSSDEPNAVAVDGNGNVFVAGTTEGNLGGTGNAGLGDSFLAKIDPATGTLVWVEQIGTAFVEVGEGVATDNSGRIYLCGETHNGDVEGTGSPPGSEDFFVASFRDNGASAVREWIRQYGTAENEYPVAIGVFDNLVYVAGYADGDLDGNVNRGSWDTFLWRIRGADGSPLGVSLLGSAEIDFAEHLAIDPGGDVYVTGRTNGDLAGPNMDPGTDPFTSSYDLFLAKFRGDGTLLWTRQAGTPTQDWGLGVASDGTGSAYLYGNTTGNLYGKPNMGGWDTFLLKYNGAGDRQ